MNTLTRKMNAADEYAATIGGVWIVYGNPADARDVRITTEEEAPTFMLPGDVVLYRAEAV